MAKKLFISSEKNNAAKAKQKKSLMQDGLLMDVNMMLAKYSSLKINDKVTFYRLFATMINAGVTIVKAVNILREQSESFRLRMILNDIDKKIKEGQTFSDALRAFPKDFSDAEIGIIHSGEVSGKLNTALINLAEQTEKSASITKKLKGAMMYPAVIMIILILAIFAVMTLVIPQIKEMFANFDADLPAATQALIDFSDFMVATGGPLGLMNVWNILGTMLLIGFAINAGRKTPKGKYIWDMIMLRLPVFGSLNKKVAISKMCRGLATLTASGVPIVKTLAICSDMIGNELYRRRVLRISEDVKIGISMADNMKGDSHFFPPMVVSMIGVGEQTAQLTNTAQKMADFYEDEADDMVKNISSLLEPIIIVVVGLAVGGLVMAIMMPILSLSDLAGA